MATLTLDNFPSPSVARQLSPNGRADWHVKVGAKQVVRERVALEVRRQGIAPIHGPVALQVTWIHPDKRRRDLDNFSTGTLKVVIDALVKLGVIDGDDYRMLRELSVRLDVQRGRRALVLTLDRAEQEAA